MTPDARVALVEGLAERAGLPCPPEASERLAAVLASATAREQAVRAAAFRERCRRAGHQPRCRTEDDCTLRILRRSVGPHVTLEYVRELRAAREGR